MKLSGTGRLRSYCRDRVQWGEDQERAARDKVEENASQLLPDHVRGERGVCCMLCQAVCVLVESYESKAAEHWDAFYHQHQNRLKVIACLSGQLEMFVL